LADINKSKAKVSTMFVKKLRDGEKHRSQKQKSMAKQGKYKQSEFNLRTEEEALFDNIGNHAKRTRDDINRGTKKLNSRAVDSTQKNIHDRDSEVMEIHALEQELK